MGVTSPSGGDALSPELAGRKVRERELSVGDVSVRFLEVLDVDAILEDAIERGEHPPYGAVPWASGIAIAQLLASRDLRGRTIVDVGAGCGVVSFVAAHQGAIAIALELDALARALIGEGARSQELDVDIRAFDLLGDEPLPDGDLYVFADLLYEGPLAEGTARRVREAMKRGGAVLVGDPGRAGRETFQLHLLEAGIDAEFRDVEVRLPGEVIVHKVGLFASDGGAP